MTWVWDDQDGFDDTFYANYDYISSTLDSYLLMGPNRLPADAGTVVLKARRYSSKRVLKYGCLPAASRDRIVHKRLAHILIDNISKDEVQLYPILVQTKDISIDSFFAVIPMNELVCTDIARSQITSWIIKDEVTSGYKTIAFHDNCLGSLNIARDSVTGLVVISDKLKLALEATGELGLHFVKPENVKPYFN
jgi:hypothetical protein